MTSEDNTPRPAAGSGRRCRDDAPATPEHVDNWVEHTITAAQRRGDFDNLPGSGKPLTALERPNDPDWWLRGLIQREEIDLSVALPGPMALRRERATYPEAFIDIGDEQRVREILLDFNERVIADRRRPVATAHSPAIVGRVDVEAMIGRWRALRSTLDVDLSAGLSAGDLVPPDKSSDPADRPAKRRGRWWRG